MELQISSDEEIKRLKLIEDPSNTFVDQQIARDEVTVLIIHEGCKRLITFGIQKGFTCTVKNLMEAIGIVSAYIPPIYYVDDIVMMDSNQTVAPINYIFDLRASPFKVITDLNAFVKEQIDGYKAKVLIILDNGNKRLVTFKLPFKDVTVQELLHKAGILSSQAPQVYLDYYSVFDTNYVVNTKPSLFKLIEDPSIAIVQQQIAGYEVKLLMIFKDGRKQINTYKLPIEDITLQDLMRIAKILSSNVLQVYLDSNSVLGSNYIVTLQIPKAKFRLHFRNGVLQL